MLKVIGVAVLSLGFVSFSYAAPAYLNCTLLNKNSQTKFSVKLDEASGKITHTNSDGSAFNVEGFFAANSIAYQDVSFVGDLKVTFKYEINRSTLAISEVSIVGPTTGVTIYGSCEVVEAAKRKI